MIDFSQKVKEAMLQKNIRKSQIARETGYSYPHIHELLNGKKRWNIETMDKVCQVVGLEIVIKSTGTD